MTQPIRLLSVSEQLTPTYRKDFDHREKSVVVTFENYSYSVSERMPARHRSVASIGARWAADPEKSERLKQARKRLSPNFHDASNCDLRGLRLQRGLSQAQLAEAAETTQPYIARIEAGRAPNVTITTLRSLSIALDRSLSELDEALRNSEKRAAPRKDEMVNHRG
jgi:DNA-binding Xre family transcriptional regulator